MNQYKPDTNGATATAEPLFASVWLALYYSLRKNYNERHVVKTAQPAASSQTQEKK